MSGLENYTVVEKSGQKSIVGRVALASKKNHINVRRHIYYKVYRD